MGVLGGYLEFLIKNMEDRVIPDVMNDLFIPQGSIPEDVMFLSSL